MKSYKFIKVKPIAGSLGVEICGVDLSVKLDAGVIDEIQQALLDYLVVFFREQSLTLAQHIAFGRSFGDLQIDRFVKGPHGYPEIMRLVKEADKTENFAGMWHSDVTFQKAPALGSILYAREVPPVGGDTMWSNMYLAYETLSSTMQALLEQLQAVHCADVSYSRAAMDKANEGDMGIAYTDDDPSSAVATHPVIRTHPDTGRKALYVNEAYTKHFVGMTQAESKPLLQQLFRHLAKPEFTCRFRWQKDSLAFWDNRCTQHLPINDYAGSRREMHRVTIVGTKPV